MSCILKIPGDGTFPIFGNLFEIRGLNHEEIMQKYLFDHPQKFRGGICRLWYSLYPAVHLDKAEYVEKILSCTQNITKNDMYNFFDEWIGRGLFVASGDRWTVSRKLLNPTFNFTILIRFVEVFVEKSVVLMKILGKYADSGEEVADILPFISHASLDMICGKYWRLLRVAGL